MNYSIEAEQVCKQFKDNLALDNVDLKVESGSICGLVGRNGSGRLFVYTNLVLIQSLYRIIKQTNIIKRKGRELHRKCSRPFSHTANHS